MLQKDRVIALYQMHKSKRKVAQILKVTRQYVIQVIKEHEAKVEASIPALKTEESANYAKDGLEGMY